MALAETQNGLFEMKSRRTVLDRQHALLREILDRIPGVEELFKQKTIAIDKLVCDIVANKNVAEPIWKRIARLKTTTTTMSWHLAVQKEHVDALVEVCILGCVDRRRALIISRILREVALYPAVVKTGSLRNQMEVANGKCRRMLSEGAFK